MSKILLLDIAREKLSKNDSRKIRHRKGEPNGIYAIDWLIKNCAKLERINYVDEFGDTILHLLIKDLPNLIKDDRLESLFKIHHLSKLFSRCTNIKNNDGKIPLDIVLDELFCEKESHKSSINNDIFVDKINIFLKYIDNLIICKSNTQKLQDNLLDIAIMCKKDNNLNVLENILNHLDDEFKKDYVSRKNEYGKTNLDILLDRLDSLEKNKGLIKFTEWLIMCNVKFKKQNTNLETYKEWITNLYAIIKKKDIPSKDFLLNELFITSFVLNNTKTKSYEQTLDNSSCNKSLQHKKSNAKMNTVDMPKEFNNIARRLSIGHLNLM